MVIVNFISSKGVLKSVNATEGETIMDCAKNNDIYDDFYVDVYDQLVYSDNKNQFEIKEIKDSFFQINSL